jgi:glycosyltransferase involved in cell wall biosynthesis
VTPRLPISLVISTRNAGDLLEGCIQSCSGWISEIVVVDMESDDDTLGIAERYGAAIVHVPNAGWAEPGRQSGFDAATQRWILVLDADERATPGMHKIVADTIAADAVDGVRLPRRNVMFGRFDRRSGVWPDWQLRFFRRDKASWPVTEPHSSAVVDGLVVEAPASEENAIRHQSEATIAEWISKMNRYTEYEADQMARDGVEPSLRGLLVLPVRGFASPYIRGGGWRSGRYGLTIALLTALYRVVTELKLWEKLRTATTQD